MCRMKSVALSIPCITGPYTGINCTLDLDKHSIRTKEMPSGGSAQIDALPFDNIPIKGIATSHGQADTETFELSYSGDTYAPFEGAGAIPSPMPQLDYSTISDVIMHVRYTSCEPKEISDARQRDEIRPRLRFCAEQGKYASLD
ncbi:uncharacterized protein BDZ99DRAFT_273759 [Mytilinidion resinicola]|uniref:Tc toxin complex TcA C-terminal TcB-binding domain-containing protein n=1 Tax=Mytilinidion resinicola TaxID=574789 RepID=A0A6A6YS31_9PEZI|nr:uncharacterized protein BDZ99DRAFT_273759 [Mytilinidion resinicola]KAF2811319.1 hypothetical protein BDZ99DRAFT_273759 [Mytilinidion resinicola]